MTIDHETLQGQLVTVHLAPRGVGTKIGTIVEDAPEKKNADDEPLKPLIVEFTNGKRGFYHYDQIQLYDEASA